MCLNVLHGKCDGGGCTNDEDFFTWRLISYAAVLEQVDHEGKDNEATHSLLTTFVAQR